MSDQISWVIEVEILPGKLEAFRAIAQELIANAKTEPETIDYEWHLSPDQKTCHIFERYASSEALVKHGQGFGAYAERFFGSCKPTRLSVYGEASAEAKAAIAELHPVYFSTLGGFSR